MERIEYEKMKLMDNVYWWFKGKREIIGHILEQYAPNARRILDIGCGSGYFFDKYSGIGIEPCSLFTGENIINERIENVSLQEQFDAILCLDVLEHLPDDTIIKKFIERNLKENGIMIVTVPAHPKLFNKHDQVNGHYRRYDYVMLKELFKEYNMEIYYYNSLLYPIAYIVRKLSKGENNLKVLPSVVNNILYRIFVLEKYLYKYLPNGLSMIAIIKK